MIKLRIFKLDKDQLKNYTLELAKLTTWKSMLKD